MNKKTARALSSATQKCQKPFKWKIYSRSDFSFFFRRFFLSRKMIMKKGGKALGQEEIFPVINNLNMIARAPKMTTREMKSFRQESPRRKFMKKEASEALIRGKVFMDFFLCVRERDNEGRRQS
jgi:hypothetical protein